MFDSIRALPYRWDVLRIRRLLECNPLSVQITDCLSRTGLAHRRRRANPSYIRALEHGYDGFLASRSAKSRNYLRRGMRKLESAGRLQLRRAGREIAVDEAYTHLIGIEQRSWKQANGTAISDVLRQREFYRLLCEGSARSGRLHLMLMYQNGRPIAYSLGITAADRYSYLKTSFVEDLRQYSLATVLRARLVESLCDAGIRYLDLPAQPYRWEAQWAQVLRWRYSLLVFNSNTRG